MESEITRLIRLFNKRERARLDAQVLRRELGRAPRANRAALIVELDEALARYARYGGDPNDTAEIDAVTTWRQPVRPNKRAIIRQKFQPELFRRGL